MNIQRETLKKICVLSQINSSEYLVEDIFIKDRIVMKIRGKMRMNFIKILPGTKAYMVLPSADELKGYLVYEKYICMGNTISYLCNQKRLIDKLENDNLN